jgi:FkbH-like protein
MTELKAPDLYWLPRCDDWQGHLARAKRIDDPVDRFGELVRLARFRNDFLLVNRLDQLLRSTRASLGDRATPGIQPFRLAILSDATVDHLLPAVRVAGLRFGLSFDIYIGAYGQYRQDVLSDSSGLWDFEPQAVLFLIGPHDMLADAYVADAGGLDNEAESRVDSLRILWRRVKERTNAVVIQANVPCFDAALFGNLDPFEPSTAQSRQAAVNERLVQAVRSDDILLLDIAGWVTRVGSRTWYDPMLRHLAKQDIHPRLAPLFGDIVARQIAAARGLSRKCLVLDLDNTIWGGVIGDDGIEGIQLGQGSASGEAFLALQQFAKSLRDRGVILAVCSKNTEAVVLDAMSRHSEMLLREADFSCLMINWDDKASNLRVIARTLNIGLDSLVFVDDNPAERALVRQELPEVAVPELPEDPSLYPYAIADGGYFEAVRFTSEDRVRARQYQDNAARERLRSDVSDMASYLKSLDMELSVGPVGPDQLARVTQLINKTNQFNLTTRRYTEAEVLAISKQENALALWGRLTDRFGDNGLITVMIALRAEPGGWRLDSWLMSCRVLGRRVEEAMLAIVAEHCRKHGATAVTGEFIKTAKNGMVADHYRKLGFASIHESEGQSLWRLDLNGYQAPDLPILVKAAHD